MASQARIEAQMTEIYCLLSANADQKEIYDTICQKFGKISERTFMRYWKEASHKHTEDQRAIKTKVMSQHTSAISSRLKTALWTQEEILWKLQNEAKEAKRASDRINAIKVICDIQGFKAPTKSEIEILATPIFSRNPLIDGIKQNPQLNA